MLRARYPCVLQRDVADCGAACVATLSLHYGRRLTLARAREVVRTDLRGTTAMGLIEGCERLGMRAHGVEATLDALAQVPLPAIAHYQDGKLGHYVVVHRVTGRAVVVADPAGGLRSLTHAEFQARWTGVLILVSPNEDFDPVPERGAARRLLHLAGGQWRDLVEAALCAVLLTVLGLGTAVYIQALVDSALPLRSTHMLHLLGAAMLLVVAARAVLAALRSYFLLHAGQRIYAGLYAAYYRHLLRLPMRFFDTRRVGELTSRLTDSARVRDLLTGTTASLAVDLIFVVGTAVAMLLYDPVLAMVALGFVPPFLLVGVALVGSFHRAQSRTMEANAELNALLMEATSSVEAIKSLTAERVTEKRVEEGLLAALGASWNTGILGVRASTLSSTLSALGILAVLWVGGYRVLRGELSMGELMGFFALVSAMLAPLQRLVDGTHRIQDGLVAAERLWEITDLEPEEPEGEERSRLRSCHGEVKLEHVSFRYGSRELVLEDVSLEIPAGQMVGLVGESGSGKTTIAKLVQGFYDAEAGYVRVDGVDVRTLTMTSLRRHIGVVPQEPLLFRGPVAENIAYGCEGEPDPERVMEAARQAGAHEFVSRLPHGYRTELGEQGVRLSTGEKQRLALARALYRDPRILILDEVTSALDARSEELVRDTIRTLHGKKTILVIAHRLSTLVYADRIVVLRQGRLVEEGTHAQLLARPSAYRDLWLRQAGAAPALS